MTEHPGYVFKSIVAPQWFGRTIECYLATTFTHSSMGQWLERLEGGELTVEGRTASAGMLLRAGQEVLWHRPGWEEPPVPLEVDWLYEDQHLLAVAKPSGLPTLPGGGFFLNTLLGRVLQRDPGARPMHRLGRATSGVVLFARNETSARLLAAGWPNYRKIYRALVTGSPSWMDWMESTPIGPIPYARLGTLHAASPTGKSARTQFHVLERRSCQETLLEAILLTGRPHQIRIHAAAAGHPLVEDPIYQAGGIPRSDSAGLPGDGGYWLHAHRLHLIHPVDGRVLQLEAPVPERLRMQEEGRLE
ncbi:MAG: pseudouridine synthase [Pirellulaceae bacterium]